MQRRLAATLGRIQCPRQWVDSVPRAVGIDSTAVIRLKLCNWSQTHQSVTRPPFRDRLATRLEAPIVRRNNVAHGTAGRLEYDGVFRHGVRAEVEGGGCDKGLPKARVHVEHLLVGQGRVEHAHVAKDQTEVRAADADT